MKNELEKAQGGRTFKGVVVSEKMKDTVVVEVTRYSRVPKYEKYMMTRKRFKVHDPGNTRKTGDVVSIQECRPISREKRFKVV